MKKTTLFLTVAILAIIATLGLFFPKGNTVVQQVLGAVSTLDGVDSADVSINGYKEWWGSVPMSATSSAICSIRNLTGATSTIEHISAFSNNVGIAEANNLYVATTSATSRFATTSVTALNSAFAMGTGKWSYLFSQNVATSTSDATFVNVLEGQNSDSSSNYILKPGESVTWFIATTTAGVFQSYDQGACSLKLKKNIF